MRELQLRRVLNLNLLSGLNRIVLAKFTSLSCVNGVYTEGTSRNLRLVKDLVETSPLFHLLKFG